MSYRRLVLSLLLITVPLLGLAPKVNSQSFTTMTSLNTMTTNLTLTEENLSTVGKVTATRSEEATLFATSVILSGVGGEGQGCNEGHFGPFYENFTQQVTGTLMSTQTINFYIMNSTQYAAWNSATVCDPRQAKGAVYVDEGINSVALQWRAPKNGVYYLVFTTLSYSDAVIVVDFGTPIHVVTSYIQYITLSSFRAAEVTETFTSVSSSQLNQSSGIPTGLIEFVLIIAVGMVAIGLWNRRRMTS